MGIYEDIGEEIKGIQATKTRENGPLVLGNLTV
jgi:hypothetical protein